MEPVVTKKPEVTLIICCQELAGTLSGPNTLVLPEPPQTLLGLKRLCERATECVKIFSWIRSMMERKWSAHIEIWCCEKCASSSTLELDQYHETFDRRCQTIQKLLPFLCERLGTVSCTVGKKEVLAEDVTISGVRDAVQLTEDGNFTFGAAVNK
ncbi:hypothetical protein KBD61_03855 [Patescibacteria group bacterium]|nr:hypothetical protein [Patescibacteria group bacterium]MBP9710131.1 hypothetical protein [Patescibacteria group bacterium]